MPFVYAQGSQNEKLHVIPLPPTEEELIGAKLQGDTKVTQTLSLDEALERAFMGSPDVEAARANLCEALQLVCQAKSAFYPSMTSHLYVTAEPDFGETAQQATSQLDGINIAPNTPVEFKVDTSWTLYNGCINRFQLLASKLNQQHASLGIAETKRLLREAVNQAYYAAVLAQLRMGIAEHNTKFNETLRDFVARRRKAGMASKSEMLNFQIKAGDARMQYYQARRDYGVLLSVLGALMNLCQPMDAEKIRLTKPDDANAFTWNPDVQQAACFAVQSRADLRQMRVRIEESIAEINVAKGAFMPDVTLQTDYSIGLTTKDEVGQTADQRGAAGLVVGWDVFQGGYRRAQLNQRKAATSRLRAEYQREILNFRGQLTALRERILWNRELVKNQTETLKYAEEDRLLVVKLYESGLVSVTRLNEVQKDYVHSAERLAAAKVYFHLAWADWWTAVAVPEAYTAMQVSNEVGKPNKECDMPDVRSTIK